MSVLPARQREAAQILFALPEADDFALAGGAALVLLGIVDRTTRDLDAFVAAKPGTPPGDVAPLATALDAALRENGWSVAATRRHPTFTRLQAEVDGERIEIDLAVDSPPLFPIMVDGGVRMLDPRDLAARKVLAILDRAEGRDFTDLWALSQDLGRGHCLGWAMQIDGGIERPAIATSFRAIERLKDDDLPVPSTDAPTVRRWFERWASDLDARA